MCSAPLESSADASTLDDRSTKARIRDAAIECFARHGIAATTARKVASVAGVSSGLVMHHFGSMEGLRSSCDEYVAAVIRQGKQEAMSTGPGLDVLAALRSANAGLLMGYIAAVLVDDSPAVAKLVDDLVADAEGYLQQGVETGMVRPTVNPRGRAAVMTLWSLGALVLHQHVQRILGVDLTDPDFGADPNIGSDVGPAYEILSEGIITEALAAQLQNTFSDSVGEGTKQVTPPDESPASSRTTRKGSS